MIRGKALCSVVSVGFVGLLPGCSLIDKMANDYEDVTRVPSIASPAEQANTIIVSEKGPLTKGRLMVDIDGANFKREYIAANACNSARARDEGAEEDQGVVDAEQKKLEEARKKREEAEQKNREEAICRAARNRIISQWMYVSNRTCAAHLGGIIGRANITNVVLELVTITTSGLATFVGGAATRQALSGSSAIAAGSKNAINSEIYLNSLAALLTKAIENNRNRLGSNLIDAMSRPVVDYSVDRAMVALSQYHESCSFRMGVQLLAEAAEHKGLTKDEIDQELHQLRQRTTDLLKLVDEMGGKVSAAGNLPQDAIYQRQLTNAEQELDYIHRRTQVLHAAKPTAAQGSN